MKQRKSMDSMVGSPLQWQFGLVSYNDPCKGLQSPQAFPLKLAGFAPMTTLKLEDVCDNPEV